MKLQVPSPSTWKLYTLMLLLFIAGCKKPHKYDETITASIEDRILYGYNPSIALAIIDENGTNYYSFGKTSINGKQVDEHTIYEIGSISKTFTAILLAKQVIEGKVSLDDPIDKFLPDSIDIPFIGDQPITLGHLSDHTSGLPRMPGNFDPADETNPFADYTVTQLYTFISSYKPIRSVGSKFEYSNLAQGLLGHILALNEGLSYEQLLIRDITGPLGMSDTRIVFTERMKYNLATGTHQTKEAPNWDLPTLAGAGGIRSSASDMIKYLSANLGLMDIDPTLRAAMDLSHKSRHKKAGTSEIGLGWFINGDMVGNITWHGGATGGYRAYAGFITKQRKGVVILTNSTDGAEDIGKYLLSSDAKLRELKPTLSYQLKEKIENESIEAANTFFDDINPDGLDAYHFNEGSINQLGLAYLQNENIEAALAVFRINVALHPSGFNAYNSYAEALLENGQTELAIENYKHARDLYPESEVAKDKLTELGIDYEPEVILLSEEMLESYVGKYRMAAHIYIEITREGTQFFGQATNQKRVELFPLNDQEFYLKVAEIKIKFQTNDSGRMTLTLYQNGQEITGKRVN